MGFARDALTAIRGTFPGRIPYAPRFDLWFNAHEYRGTLPEAFRGCASSLDIARRIGVGAHMVIADFIRPEEPEQVVDRGIGLYNLPQFPFRTTLENVGRTVTTDGGETTVVYRTPKGSITAAFAFTEDMRRAGASISTITRHPIGGEEDVAPLVHLFENIRVEPAYGGLERMIAGAGDDGPVVANASLPASPMQFIMRDLMPVTDFYFAMADYPEKLRSLADAIGGFFERMMPVAAQCPADIILFGANTDETITYPPFYEEQILPWIARFSGMVHDRGKFLLIHADGENRGLFDLYRQSGIDILEAVATAPMTTCGIAEILDRTAGMTVWGGIPSVVLMPEHVDGPAFGSFMRRTIETVGDRPRFILGISDTTPPDADFDRLLKIRDML